MKTLNKQEMNLISGGNLLSGISGAIIGYNIAKSYFGYNNPWVSLASTYMGAVVANGIASWCYNESKFASFIPEELI